MLQVRVGKWGKNLAIRVPFKIAKAAGLNEGDYVEIKTRDRDIVIHSSTTQVQAIAAAAAEEIIAESEHYTLGSISIRELLEDGRRE